MSGFFNALAWLAGAALSMALLTLVQVVVHGVTSRLLGVDPNKPTGRLKQSLEDRRDMDNRPDRGLTVESLGIISCEWVEASDEDVDEPMLQVQVHVRLSNQSAHAWDLVELRSDARDEQGQSFDEDEHYIDQLIEPGETRDILLELFLLETPANVTTQIVAATRVERSGER